MWFLKQKSLRLVLRSVKYTGFSIEVVFSSRGAGGLQFQDAYSVDDL